MTNKQLSLESKEGITIIFMIINNHSLHFINGFCYKGNKIEKLAELIHPKVQDGTEILLHHFLYLSNGLAIEKIVIGNMINLRMEQLKQILGDLWDSSKIVKSEAFEGRINEFKVGNLKNFEFAITFG